MVSAVEGARTDRGVVTWDKPIESRHFSRTWLVSPHEAVLLPPAMQISDACISCRA